MPNWKKVIVSGSDASLNTLSVLNGIQGNTVVTGSLTVVTGSAVELQVTNTGVNIGSISTDIHNVTGSFNVRGSVSVSGSQTITGSVIIANITNPAQRNILTTDVNGFLSFQNLVYQNSIGNGNGSVNLTQNFISTGNTSTAGYMFSSNTNAIPGTQDVGIRRNTSGSIEIFNGLTGDGTLTNRRDLLVRNITGSNAVFNGSFNISGSSNITGSLSVNGLTTLNGNQLITGTATIGSSSLGPNENTLTLGARDTVNEGGQVGFNAPGGTFTSASFIDNWSNKIRILKGNNTTSTGLVAQWDLHTNQMQLAGYTNVSSFAGTASANLAVDSSGNVITVATTGGSIFPYTGNAVITGSLTATTGLISPVNGGAYLRGGDDVELWDINISNHLGIYGQQDQTVASIKLGSGGGIISGKNGFTGINTINPLYGLDINANTLTGARIYSGSLAVGNIIPSAIVGRIDASNDVVAFSTSDSRLKTNIKPIKNALEKVSQIGGYEFDWNDEIEIHGYEGHDVGVIAQEIESILPEVVTTRDNGYKAVKYEKIVPFLIQCIKELKDEIHDLKSQK